MSTSWVWLFGDEQRLTGRWRKLSFGPCSAVPPHTFFFSYYSSFGFYQLAVRCDTGLAAESEEQKTVKERKKNHYERALYFSLWLNLFYKVLFVTFLYVFPNGGRKMCRPL